LSKGTFAYLFAKRTTEEVERHSIGHRYELGAVDVLRVWIERIANSVMEFAATCKSHSALLPNILETK
jgi:hypothetical protein